MLALSYLTRSSPAVFAARTARIRFRSLIDIYLHHVLASVGNEAPPGQSGAACIPVKGLGHIHVQPIVCGHHYNIFLNQLFRINHTSTLAHVTHTHTATQTDRQTPPGGNCFRRWLLQLERVV